ncbi:hypothetical protein ACL90Y_00190 [Micrococcus luteus]
MDNTLVYVVIGAIIVVLIILIVLSVVAGKRRRQAELEQEQHSEAKAKERADVRDGAAARDKDAVKGAEASGPTDRKGTEAAAKGAGSERTAAEGAGSTAAEGGKDVTSAAQAESKPGDAERGKGGKTAAGAAVAGGATAAAATKGAKSTKGTGEDKATEPAKGAESDASRDSALQAGGAGVTVDEADADKKVGKGGPWDTPKAPDAKDPSDRKPLRFTKGEEAAQAEAARGGKAPAAPKESGKGGQAAAGAAVAGGSALASFGKEDEAGAAQPAKTDAAADAVSGDSGVQAGGRGVSVDEAEGGAKTAAAGAPVADAKDGKTSAASGRDDRAGVSAAPGAVTGAGVGGGIVAAGVAGGQGVQVDDDPSGAKGDAHTGSDDRSGAADRTVIGSTGAPKTAEPKTVTDAQRQVQEATAASAADVSGGDRATDRTEAQGSGAGTAAVVDGAAVVGGAAATGAAAHGGKAEKAKAPQEGTFGDQTLKHGTDVLGTEKDQGSLLDEPTAGHTADGTRIESVTDEQLKAQSENESVEGLKPQQAASGGAGTSAATGVTGVTATDAAAAGTGAARAEKPGTEEQHETQRDGYAVTGVPGYAGPVSDRARREVAEEETAGTAAAASSGAAATTGRADADRREAPAEETLGEAHTPAAERPVQAGGMNRGGQTASVKDNLLETAKGAASVAAKGAAKGAEAGAKGAVKGASFLRDKLAQAQERRWKGRK